MAYRLQYAITDPTRALGASPLRGGGVARETDWRMVMGEIRWSPGNLGEHLIDPRVLGVFDASGRVDPHLALRALHDGAPGHTEPADGRAQRIRVAPSHTLRRRVSEALALLRQRPLDRSAELERLARARDAAAVLSQHDLVATGSQPQQPDGALRQQLDRLRDGLRIVGPDPPGLPAPPDGLVRDP
jgi:hypothetical protein